MPPFWQKLEDMPEWEAVAAEWRRHIGGAFEALTGQRIIAPNGKFAAGHPCTRKPPCGCWHRQKPGTLTMVCDCEERDCADFTVTQDDLRIQKLDTLRLADAVRALLSVKKPVRKLPEIHGVFALGTYSPVVQASYPAYLIVPSSPEALKEAVAALATTHDRQIAAVLFTRASLDPRQEAAMRRTVFFLFLDEAVGLAGDGLLALLPGVRDPLRPMHRTTAAPVTDNELVRAVEVARQLSANRPRRGPTALEYITAVADGMAQTEIARRYHCSTAQVSAIKHRFEERFGKKAALLIGVRGDLHDMVKTASDDRAKKIQQRAAVLGEEKRR